jgi:hypothetical protein
MHPQRRFARWVDSRRWVVARTMPQWPHEYTSVDRKRDPPEVIRRFEWAVLYIRRHGERRRFLPTGSRFDYLDHGDHSYWSMGWPVAQTILINRAMVDDDHPLHVVVRRRVQARESSS